MFVFASSKLGNCSSYEYTQTTTSCGRSCSPYWRLASTVTEDVGVLGTRTGRAVNTVDAAGKSWGTTFLHEEGLVSSVSYKATPTSSSIPCCNLNLWNDGNRRGNAAHRRR
ncbi:MAG: hypothetical protein ABL949_13610 [Fimbriimonadaceae bacterium]